MAFNVKNHHILVIDDEKEVCDLLQKAFSYEGAHVITAQTGYQGFQCLMNSHFDLVLMDLRMPEMDGFEAIKAIRQIDPIIPIIVITGYSSQDNKEKILSLGANHFFSKPFDIEEVLKISYECINEKTHPNIS